MGGNYPSPYNSEKFSLANLDEFERFRCFVFERSLCIRISRENMLFYVTDVIDLKINTPIISFGHI